MRSTKFLCILLIFSGLFWLANCPVKSQPGIDSNNPMKIHDEQNRIDFINEITNASAAPDATRRLCQTEDSESGVSQPNKRTIRDFLGPNLKSISVTYVAGVETHERFYLAKDAMTDALLKSPKTFYRFEPWANAVKPDFIGRVNYASGKHGDVFLSYGYLCVQDENGKHWWMRFTTSEDLNLTSMTGVLSFGPQKGYRLITKEGREIWLQMTENKIIIGQLEKLLNSSVTVSGETRIVPKNVTTAIPSGKEYFVYGFKIEAARQ